MRLDSNLGPRVTSERIRSTFGNAGPVKGRIWEVQFDGAHEELARLARTPWDELFDQSFWVYFHDLNYQELQYNVFNYLFPACLIMAQKRLMKGRWGLGAGDADFMRSLSSRNWTTVCTDARIQETERILIDGLLDRLDRQEGFHDLVFEGDVSDPISRFNWLGRVNSLGYILASIEPLWTEWWAMATPGRAIAAIEYVWGLAMREDEEDDPTLPSPIGDSAYFDPDAEIWTRGWQEANARFLASTLSYDGLLQKTERAVAILTGRPEEAVAQNVLERVGSRKETVETRLRELLRGLGNPTGRDSPDHYGWSDA